jgi:hypothetical protein
MGFLQWIAETIKAPPDIHKEPAMDSSSVFVPFAGTMLLTMVVWVYMYARRLPFLARSGMLKQRRITPEELAQRSPPGVAMPSDNLKNLFEMPTLFYAVVLYLAASGQVDSAYVVAAWAFFLLRVAHSIVHCTFNFIPLRFLIYVGSSLALWFMVVRLSWRLCGQL